MVMVPVLMMIIYKKSKNATRRQMRQIRSPRKYGYTNLVAYALTVAEVIKVQEPSTYSNSITSSEFAQWVVTRMARLRLDLGIGKIFYGR